MIDETDVEVVAEALGDLAEAVRSDDDERRDFTTLTDGLVQIGGAIQRLGNGDACTGGWGAIEGHATKVLEAGQLIAGGLESVAAALDRIATVMEGKQ